MSFKPNKSRYTVDEQYSLPSGTIVSNILNQSYIAVCGSTTLLNSMNVLCGSRNRRFQSRRHEYHSFFNAAVSISMSTGALGASIFLVPITVAVLSRVCRDLGLECVETNALKCSREGMKHLHKYKGTLLRAHLWQFQTPPIDSRSAKRPSWSFCALVHKHCR